MHAGREESSTFSWDVQYLVGKKKKKAKREKDILHGMITPLSTSHLQDFHPAPKSPFIIWTGRNGEDISLFFHVFHMTATLRWHHLEETPVPFQFSSCSQSWVIYFHCTEVTVPAWCHRFAVLFLLGSIQGICSIVSMKNVLNKSVHIIKCLLAPWKHRQVWGQ